MQGGNAVGISWFGGQIGSQSIAKNIDLQSGEFSAYNPDWNGATSYDVIASGGQFRSYGGHSESAAFFNSSASDPQTDQSAIDLIYGLQGSNSGATSIYHQAARTLQIQASFFSGNVRVGNGAILEGDSIRFGGASGYVNDAGAVNRVITSPLSVANGGTGVATSTGTGAVVLSNSPTLVTPNIGAATGTSLIAPLFGTTTSTDVNFLYGNTNIVTITGLNFYPTADNTTALGTASHRWSTIYSPIL